MNDPHPLYLLGDVARQLNTPPYRITYLFTLGKVPEPELRLGGRRVFTEADVRRIARHLTAQKDNEL